MNYEMISIHYIYHAALNLIKTMLCVYHDDANSKNVFSFLEQTKVTSCYYETTSSFKRDFKVYSLSSLYEGRYDKYIEYIFRSCL